MRFLLKKLHFANQTIIYWMKNGIVLYFLNVKSPFAYLWSLVTIQYILPLDQQ